MAISKQTLLDNLEITINAIITGGAVKSYSTAGKQLDKMSLTELMAMRDKLMAELAAESNSTNYATFKDPF